MRQRELPNQHKSFFPVLLTNEVGVSELVSGYFGCERAEVLEGAAFENLLCSLQTFTAEFFFEGTRLRRRRSLLFGERRGQGALDRVLVKETSDLLHELFPHISDPLKLLNQARPVHPNFIRLSPSFASRTDIHSAVTV